MKTIEPRRIEIADTLTWIKLAAQLIQRRLMLFFLLVFAYFGLMYIAIHAVLSLTVLVSPVVILAILFAFLAIALCLFMGEFSALAYCSDHSQPVQWRHHIVQVLFSQGSYIKMALFALSVGAFYWVVSFSMKPGNELLVRSEELVAALTLAKSLPIWLECQMLAGFLYFMLLATVSLRSIFAIPLILFHEMSYHHAQQLSHKAIMLNLKPLSMIFAAWAIGFLGALKVLPPLAALFLPLFGVFLYVAYRDIFLGIQDNLREHATNAASVSA